MPIENSVIMGSDFLDNHNIILDFGTQEATLVEDGDPVANVPLLRDPLPEQKLSACKENPRCSVTYRHIRKALRDRNSNVYAVYVRDTDTQQPRVQQLRYLTPVYQQGELNRLEVQEKAYTQLGPNVVQAVVQFLTDATQLDQFSGSMIRTETANVVPSMNMLQNNFHLNSVKGREAYARQYQRTNFFWTDEGETEWSRSQLLADTVVQCDNENILHKLLSTPRTLMVGVTFNVKDESQKKRIERIVGKNVIWFKFRYPDGTVVNKVPDYAELLQKAGSPLALVEDLLYSDETLPDGAVPHLMAAQDNTRKQLQELLRKFCDVFPAKLPKHLPPDRGIGDVHHIPLKPESKPAAKKLYRHSPNEQLLIKKEIDELLENGAIRPSASPWGSPVLFVKKPDGSLRFCTDFRALNSKTVRDAYPLPRHDDLIDQLGGARYFSSLDLRSGYWQCRIAEQDVHKAAFLTRYGHYEWRVMPFGLTNAPATFMRTMNNLFSDLLDKGVVVFLDDILIYSRTVEEHVELLTQVFERLRKYQFFCKLKKCQFFRRSTTFLGFDISNDGIAINANKVKAIEKWPVPVNVQQVQSFLGFAQYLRRYIKSFSDIAAPLFALTRKDSKWQWGKEQSTAFEQLKRCVTTAPVLEIFDVNAEHEVLTDASSKAIGAVLMQRKQGTKQQKPIAYFSQKLNAAQQNYSATDREMLAIVQSLRHWRAYLFGHTVVVKTDHKPLTYFFSQPNLSPRQLRWAEILSDYLPDLRIVHTAGNTHVLPDRLSRRPDYLAQMYVSTITSDFLRQLQIAQKHDLNLREMWRSAQGQHPDYSVFQNSSGAQFLMHKDRLVVPAALVPVLLREYHDHRGHFGQQRTVAMLREQFYWPKMMQNVQRHCSQCEICQRMKYDQRKSAGLYQPLPVPEKPWQQIHIDFIVDLPEDQGHRTVMTVVDRFSKMAVFVPLKETTAEHVAKAFFQRVVSEHGVPHTITSDRDVRFTGQFWKRLMELCNTQLQFSTAYHPQTDGMAEVTNRTLQQLIRQHVRDEKWMEVLPWAQLAYNATPQSRTGLSPYYVATGRILKLPLDLALSRSELPAVKQFADNLQHVWSRTQELLADIAATNKVRADASRRTAHIAVGDQVLLSTKNLTLKKKTKKLQPKWVGPYEVLEQIGSNAFKLKLPSSVKMHPVFNVSLLKPYRGERLTPAPIELADQEEYEIEKILEHRIAKKIKNKIKFEYLIRWKGYDASEDSWLREQDLYNASDILSEYKLSHELP